MLEHISALLRSANTMANMGLLREGVAPSPFDRELINEYSCLLDTELGHVQAKICQLNSVRDQIVAQLAISRSLVAPVRRLPREILAEIFLHYFKAEKSNPTKMISYAVAPVCYTWWMVARSATALWTNISLGPSAARMRHHLDACVDLSGSRELDIYAFDGFRHAEVIPQLAQLAPAWIRWRTLWLPLHHIESLNIPFQKLTCLEKVACYCPSYSRDRKILHDLSRAGRVRQLHLEDFGDLPGLLLPSLCFLTRLSLTSSYCSFRIIIPLLGQCSATLVHLYVSYAQDRTSSTSISRHTPVLLLKLVSINLCQLAHEILPFLKAPDLKFITLQRGGHGFGNAFESLDAYLSLSGFSIQCPQRLSFLEYTVPHAPAGTQNAITRLLGSCLERLNDLQELCAMGCELDAVLANLPDELVARLGCISGHAPLLPNLTTVTLRTGAESPPLTPASRRVLHDIIRSRSTPRIVCGRAVAALKRIDADFDLGVDTAI
ncbi:uncharacterized protein SCHCODRAFT_02242713 [Schizophyllum commune H4-8]|nr:uncharacterized protein SCHCODRAFT_02242713 [Schizophyllum commune H4-8]KAI5892964.1 hypothetical protein SCHCODRAFT_02242713 [Schizophyllum commune H4-8]